MKTTRTVTLFASTLTLALGMGLATSAHAGDFEDNYPAFAAAQANPAQAAAEQVVDKATTPRRNPRASVSTEESRAMLGEDSGSFWLSQQWYVKQPAAVAKADSLKR